MFIDLNCDLGEGAPFDADLMPLITSANIACGGHAGDLSLMLATVRLAQQHGVQIGAHPGFLDRANFGRQELQQGAEQTYQEVSAQIASFIGVAEALGMRVSYVKPHGALYNMACRDERVAKPVVEAALRHGLPIMALPGSRLEALCQGRIDYIPEGFADRRYKADGSLVPRDQPGAFVEDPAEAVAQAESLLRAGRIRTLCVHGDNPEALAFVRSLRPALVARGFTVRAFAPS